MCESTICIPLSSLCLLLLSGGGDEGPLAVLLISSMPLRSVTPSHWACLVGSDEDSSLFSLNLWLSLFGPSGSLTPACSLSPQPVPRILVQPAPPDARTTRTAEVSWLGGVVPVPEAAPHVAGGQCGNC